MRLRSCKNSCCACETTKYPKTGITSSGSECAVSVHDLEKNDYEMPSNYYWSDSSAVIGRIRGFNATSCFHCQQAFRSF